MVSAVMIWLGRNGNKLTWERKDYLTREDLKRIQRRWAIAGWIVGPLMIVFSIVTAS